MYVPCLLYLVNMLAGKLILPRTFVVGKMGHERISWEITGTPPFLSKFDECVGSKKCGQDKSQQFFPII